MAQYIAYHLDQDGGNPAPVAVGASENEARESAIVHILMLGFNTGALSVQKRDDVPEDAYRSLTQFLQTFFNRAVGHA